MTTQTNLAYSTLKPGFLVSLKTSVKGGIDYIKDDIERKAGKNTETKRWTTTRIVNDVAEHERAIKAQNSANAAVRRICSKTNFGLLCPLDRADDLHASIAEARRIADDFNRKARTMHLSVGVIAGKVASDDREAIRAINGEVRDLLDAMRQGIKDCSPKMVREAANKLRQVGQMVSPGAQEHIKAAIEVARASARKTAKSVEQAAVDMEAFKKIGSKRTAFLDMGGVKEVAKPKARGRAVVLPKGAVAEAPAAI